MVFCDDVWNSLVVGYTGLHMDGETSKKMNVWKYGLGALVVLAILFYFAYVFRSQPGSAPVVQTATSTPATTTVSIGGVTMELPPGVTATVTPDTSAGAGPAPSLDRKIVFPANFPPDAQRVFLSNLASLKSDIAKNPTSYDDWIQLGIDWKMVSDYEGARQAWEYATKLEPKNPIAFGNLGYLYGYYLHDLANAEANYDKAIENAPGETQWYQQAFEFYRDVEKDAAKARAVAQAGEKATGNRTLFEQLLSTL